MKQLKYKVLIPNPESKTEDDKYIEKLLHDKQDVLEFLEINSNTFQRICNGTLKCISKDTQRLYGIKIDKLKVDKVKHSKISDTNIQLEKSLEFAKILLNKSTK